MYLPVLSLITECIATIILNAAVTVKTDATHWNNVLRVVVTDRRYLSIVSKKLTLRIQRLVSA